ncbi:MAG: XRE family transcriptional regulator [Desulfobacterales bacterium]|nr:XRE family transcriptional regulator [Desulfobacterales bacterium]
MSDEIEYLEGSGNVFEDLGFDNPEEELAKAKLASTIYDIIQDRKLTEKEAGVILGISQSKVSALKDGKLAGFSIERLFSFLRALDQDIDIVIHPKSENKSSGINVTTAYA